MAGSALPWRHPDGEHVAGRFHFWTVRSGCEAARRRWVLLLSRIAPTSPSPKRPPGPRLEMKRSSEPGSARPARIVPLLPVPIQRRDLRGAAVRGGWRGHVVVVWFSVTALSCAAGGGGHYKGTVSEGFFQRGRHQTRGEWERSAEERGAPLLLFVE